jgi:hypothetical protein
MGARLEVVACPACGVVNEQASATVAGLRADIANLEVELRSKRARISALLGEQAAAIQDGDGHAEAMEILREWRRLCSPKARELGGPRLERVMARLAAGYTTADLLLAVRGYAARPFVVNGKRRAVGKPSQRYVDAELIFRDATRVDVGIQIATEEGEEMTARGAQTDVGQLVWNLGL